MLIIFLDTETTGLDPAIHKILEIAFKVLDTKKDQLICSYSSLLCHHDDVWDKRDPSSFQINKLEKDFVNQNGKNSEVVSREILDLFSLYNVNKTTAVFLCQNPSMDRSFFSHLISPKIQHDNNIPYHWLDLASMFWGLEGALNENFCESTINLLSKDNIAQYLGLEKEKFPHRAYQGVEHLMFCYTKLISKIRNTYCSNKLLDS